MKRWILPLKLYLLERFHTSIYSGEKLFNLKQIYLFRSYIKIEIDGIPVFEMLYNPSDAAIIEFNLPVPESSFKDLFALLRLLRSFFSRN